MRPILICGFGSIGRRHFRNLKALGRDNFVFYRTGKGTLPSDEIAHYPQTSDLREALSYEPEIAVISNPTALHVPVALECAKAGCHLYMEKPVSHNRDGVEELQAECKRRGLVTMVGYQWRFLPELAAMKGAGGDSATMWYDNAPQWHPWEKFGDSYAAREELGGGALLTLSHAVDAVRFLFGDLTCRQCEMRPDAGCDMWCCVTFVAADGGVHRVNVDLTCQPSHLLICNNGGIEFPCDRRDGLILDCMTHFLDCVAANKQTSIPLSEGIATLDTCLAAKAMAREVASV